MVGVLGNAVKKAECRVTNVELCTLHSDFSIQKMAECRGLAPLPRRIDLLSTQSRFACPVDIPIRARGRLAPTLLRILSTLSLHWTTWAKVVLAFGASKPAIGSPASLSPCRAM